MYFYNTLKKKGGYTDTLTYLGSEMQKSKKDTPVEGHTYEMGHGSYLAVAPEAEWEGGLFFIVGIFCCCSVAKSCPTPCDPAGCHVLGFSAFHCLLEFTQIHVG